MTFIRMSAVAVACTLAASFAAIAQPGRQKITIIHTATTAFSSAYMGKDENFFAKRGLDVELMLTSNGSNIPAAVLSNSAQIGGPTPTVFLQAVDAGLDLVIVGGTAQYPSPSPAGILTLASGPLRTAKDLIGRKIGVPGLNGLLDIMAREWLKTKGVDERQVNFVEMGYPQMADGLRSGQVDAVAVSDAAYQRIMDEKLGFDIGNYLEAVPAGAISTAFIATRSWAQTNKAAVSAFQEGLADGANFARDPKNVDALRAAVSKYAKMPSSTVATIPMPPNLTPTVKPAQLQYWIDVSASRGMIRSKLDAARLIYK